MSSTRAVIGNAGTLGVGPYVVPNVCVDAYGLYTNNPPCGAMRGFGAVQACFAYEAQMDRLAAELGIDPVYLRMRNAMEQGSLMPTGQVVDSPAPVAELLRLVREAPMPSAPAEGLWPGGVANTTHGEGVLRGTGYAVGFKNVGFSEGYDDYTTVRVALAAGPDGPVATVHCAACELGQGLVTVEAQIARSELGVGDVVVETADTRVGSAGSSSASRQTYMTAGAIKEACAQVRSELLARAASTLGAPIDGMHWGEGEILGPGGAAITLSELVAAGPVDKTVEWRHRPTQEVDPETGQGNAHVQYSFAAHRAVVDVDTELGLVKVVQIDTAQDVGKAMNPSAVVGQIHGGTTQGLGLALMEEIQVENGMVKNPSFTDYLIPTILDVPPMKVQVLELADPHAPYGVRGVGEAPTISSTPAIVAAVRAATGRALTHVPLRPEDIVGLGAKRPARPVKKAR